MAKVVMALMILALAHGSALAHEIQGEYHQENKAQEQTEDSKSKAQEEHKGDESSAKSNAGPLERAGKELDKALGRTVKVLTNSALEFRVKNHLHSHKGMPWRELVVTARDGEVTIEGEVESLEVMEKVVDIAQATKGVKTVINKLRIKPSTAPMT